MARILLVEGDDDEAQDLQKTLRGREDWDVVTARTLIEAIRVAGEGTFDAAVLNADMPDGSGLDILDFLRIGSPGIRIMLLSAKPNEHIAFHALSHGAGDFMVKDKHLDQELPRRIDAMLDHPTATGALVETLTAVGAYDRVDYDAPRAAGHRGNALDALLVETVASPVLAAGVWDLRGRPIAVQAPADVDGDGLGFAMATIHGQVGALWTYGNLKPTGYRLVIDVEGGLIAVTAIPGTYLVALMFESGFAPRRALDRVDQVGMRVLAALQGGSSGEDLSR